MPRLPLRPVALLVVGAAAVAAVIVVPRLGDDDPLTLAGRDVSGLADVELAAAVDELANTLPAAPVTLATGTADLASTAGALGVTVDRAATLAALQDAASGDVTPVVTVAEDLAAATLTTLDTSRTALREPSITLSGTQFVAQPGAPGQGLVTDDVVAALRSAPWAYADPVTIAVDAKPLEPRFGLADAEAVAARANQATASPLDVSAGTATATVPPDVLRTWVRAVPSDAGLVLGVQPDVVSADLARLLAGATTQPTDAAFDVVDGTPRIVPGQPGRACCAPDAPTTVVQALAARPAGPLVLPLVETAPARPTEALQALGIVEEVGTFTTRHNAGEARVRNIHKVADIMKGYVIGPGEMLSMNGVLGQRTTDKGYVAAPAIVNGQLKPEVGGGISQFMTTLFNAAFFAGLDYGEYQSHTIYISRYPYGREATLNWEHPDLQIRNTTPYGVLVWPTYTSSTITVTLFSTKLFSSVEQSGQSVVKSGVACDVVTTERTRTYLDGRTAVDTVKAQYRPENTRCDGTNVTPTTTTSTTTTTTTTVPPSVPPTSEAPATTAPASTTTSAAPASSTTTTSAPATGDSSSTTAAAG